MRLSLKRLYRLKSQSARILMLPGFCYSASPLLLHRSRRWIRSTLRFNMALPPDEGFANLNRWKSERFFLRYFGALAKEFCNSFQHPARKTPKIKLSNMIDPMFFICLKLCSILSVRFDLRCSASACSGVGKRGASQVPTFF